MSTKHNLIQHQLNLKRAPLDEWNTHEQLCLASAVACSGDQNWMSVSRALKGCVSDFHSRPQDWFASKSCATQYGKLLESVETTKRKKRTASERDQPAETPSTPVESLVKKLTNERIIELKKVIHGQQMEYSKLKEDMLFLRSDSMDEGKLREMWNQIEQEKIQEERAKVRHDQWLKEREEKKLQFERQWRPGFKTALKAQKSVQEDMTADAAQQQAVSQSAPTLITLLDKKSAVVQDPSTSEKQQLMMSISVPEGSGGKDGADGKDEEADILADFNELIADKFDDEDLEDINDIIMNPEILGDKLPEDEPIKEDEPSTDDYDKLKIKQLVEDFAGVPDVDVPAAAQESVEQVALTSPDESEVIQVPSEPEISNPTSVEMMEPNESNDSKVVDSPAQDDKVMIISDESCTNDDKKEKLSEKIDAVEGEESQGVKSTAEEAKEVSEDDASKEVRPFKEFQEREATAVENEKEQKDSSVYQVDDSDEDVLFEDAKESHDDSVKKEKNAESDKKLPEKVADVVEVKPSTSKTSVTEASEKARSAGSIDSDDEVLEVKVSRSTGRKKANESFKAETPSSSRTRDHSENDDKLDATPIRTRSRHSSLIPATEPKSTFNFSKEQDHSMWKGRWEDCLKDLQKLKDFSTVIDHKTIPDDSYKSVILCPMSLKLMQKNIDNNVSTLTGDVKRDFALMCTNIIMLNKKGSKFNDIVHQFMTAGFEVIENNLDVEDVFKSYRKQIKKKN